MIRPRGRGDVVVELVDPNVTPLGEPSDSAGWWPRVDVAWSKRAAISGQVISGSSAASDVAEVLGVPKLSASRYKTLQRILDASDQLRASWLREGNTIIRR